MNKQIERILICLLWLLAATLGASFWLNTMFGFNIFSAQHWQYLAYMQASQTPVRGAFYISLIFTMLITLGVLYILIRPHGILKRRTGIDRAKRAQTANEQDIVQTTETISYASQAAPQTPMRPRGPATMLRSCTSVQQMPSSNTQGPILATTPTLPAQTANTIDFDAIKQIFSDTGYTVKRSPQIGNFRPAVLAIGTDEALWIGGAGIPQETLSSAMERLSSIFSDTLDDIEININGFIIAPSTPISDNEILSFSDINELREYMDAHKNDAPTDNDSRENFNAYSEYIDTVINYMDKT